MRYLVTGCAGFIGSSLVRALLDRGDEVVGIDNFSTGKPANLAGLRTFRCIEGDLTDIRAAEEACRGIDVIFHQAAVPFGPLSPEDCTPSQDANVSATLNLLVSAQKTKVSRVIYAGSCVAYGEGNLLLTREDMAPDPVSPYAVSKLVGEYYMKSFHRVYGMETAILRYFHVFGPRQDENSPYSGTLSRIITRLLEGREPIIGEDPEETREFTYVDNVIQANLLAGSAKASAIAGQVINVASGSPTSYGEVLSIVKTLVQRGTSADSYVVDPRLRDALADISKARKLLNYRPQIELREGLRRTVNWYEGGALQPYLVRSTIAFA